MHTPYMKEAPGPVQYGANSEPTTAATPQMPRRKGGASLDKWAQSFKEGKQRPCARRPAPVWMIGIGSCFHFCCPLIVGYYLVRQVAAGNADVATSVLVTLITGASSLFCCTVGCCRRVPCICLWLGLILTATLMSLACLNHGELIHANGYYNATKRIAIVGGGPSGTTAAWVLTHDNPDAVIDVYEYNPSNGGHSDTVWTCPSGSGTLNGAGNEGETLQAGTCAIEDALPIDIGFIFSTPDFTCEGGSYFACGPRAAPSPLAQVWGC